MSSFGGKTIIFRFEKIKHVLKGDYSSSNKSEPKGP